MALKLTKFLTGANSIGGLAEYLTYFWPKYGTATVPSGSTSIDVTDARVLAGDLILASVITKGANACHVVGTTVTAGTKFNIAVNTDPGAGGVVIGYIVLRPTT